MRNLACNLLQSRLFKALTLTLLRTRTITPQLGIFPFDFSIYVSIFVYFLYIFFLYFFLFCLQLRVTQLDIAMQNRRSFGAPMIASVGQGRIYSVHLQLARGVEPKGGLGWPRGGWGVAVVVMLRPKVTCSAPHKPTGRDNVASETNSNIFGSVSGWVIL